MDAAAAVAAAASAAQLGDMRNSVIDYVTSGVLLTLGGFCLPAMLDKDNSGILLKVNVNMYN